MMTLHWVCFPAACSCYTDFCSLLGSVRSLCFILRLLLLCFFLFFDSASDSSLGETVELIAYMVVLGYSSSTYLLDSF